MSVYVTFRGVNATVRSMQAVGQIPKEKADAVLVYAKRLLEGESWKDVRHQILLKVDDEGAEGLGIVEQIEIDAAVSTGTPKII